MPEIRKSVSKILGEYNAHLSQKVEAGRASMRAGIGRADEEVEAIFSAKRQQVMKTKERNSSKIIV